MQRTRMPFETQQRDFVSDPDAAFAVLKDLAVLIHRLQRIARPFQHSSFGRESRQAELADRREETAVVQREDCRISPGLARDPRPAASGRILAIEVCAGGCDMSPLTGSCNLRRCLLTEVLGKPALPSGVRNPLD